MKRPKLSEDELRRLRRLIAGLKKAHRTHKAQRLASLARAAGYLV